MSKSKTSVDLGALEQDLRKYANAVARNAASAVADELMTEADNVIQEFYADYTPQYYQRHFYNFENNSYLRYYSNPHNTIFRGGVELTPDALDNIYNYPGSGVFASVYAGYHGLPLGSTPVMFPSPMNRLYMKQEEIIKNIDQYIDAAKSMASRESYQILFK